jgi:pimeloyl-ACP methyl ester carboxylesterase
VNTVQVGDIELVYEAMGDRGHPPVILVMGLGAQLHYWPDGFCQALVDRGLFVVRFDNRDTGLSTHLPDGPQYGLEAMAADVVGLVRALGHSSAHLVGVSLGGVIVQVAAIDHPDAVRSLVSISSTTGDPAVGAGRPEALAALFTPPAEISREAIGAHSLALSRVIGSTGFALDERFLQERAMRSFDRCYDPAGVVRHAMAAASASDRTPRLRELRVPALVIHGSDDPLVGVSGAVATAEAIPGAELMVIDGMGHDIPPATWPRIADGIDATVRRAEAT